MTATTPNKAIPYAEPADARGAGANAMRDLAQKVDDLLTAKDPVSFGVVNAGPVSLANNVWTDVPDLTWTYTGPARWFLVSFGGNLAVNGTMPNGYARLLFDGSPAGDLIHSDNYDHLGGAIPMLMGAGAYATVIMSAKTNDGSGATAGAIDNAWLRIASLG